MVRSRAVALGVAAAVALGLLGTIGGGPLPAIPWAAVFLFLVTAHDVRSMRIPNWLNFGSLAAVLAGHGLLPQGDGLAAASAGAAAVLALLLVPYASGGVRGGDVKAGVVLGALWGFGATLAVLFWSLVAGALLGLVWVLLDGGLVAMLRRWWTSFFATLATRRFTWLRPEPGSAAAGALPFGPTLAIGAIATQLWGTPWLR